MKYIIYFILIFTPLIGHSQICPEDNVYPSPDASAGGFDWRVYGSEGNYAPFAGGEVWIDQEVGPPIPGENYPNPYIDFQNSNIGTLANTPYDYESEDGWVLIGKRLGDENGTGPNHVTHPVFVMYNRYTATLRVFVLVTHKEENFSNKAVVYVSWDNGQNSNLVGSGVLSHIESPMNALNTFNEQGKVQEFIKANTYGSNDSFYWMYSDFPMSYDPCVCTQTSLLRVGTKLIDIGNISLTIDQVPQNPPPVSGGTHNTNSSFFSNAFGLINGVTKKGTERTKSLNDALSLAESVSSLYFMFQQDSVPRIVKKENNTFEVAQVANPAKFKIPAWLKLIPKVGQVIGFIEFMTAANNPSGSATSMQLAKLVANGTVTFESPFGEMLFLTPGAQQGNYPNEAVPEYNNPMGIFNLLELPKVEFLEHTPNTNINHSNSSSYQMILPNLRHYRLKEDLKYVINPAAGLEVVDMQASLLFELDSTTNSTVPAVNSTGVIPLALNGNNGGYINHGPYGPLFTGPINPNISDSMLYREKLLRNGIDIEYWKNISNGDINDIRYRTKYLPLGGLTSAGFYIYKYEENSPYENQPAVYCKIKMILKRTDDPNADEIIHVVTFKTDIEEGAAPEESVCCPVYNLYDTEPDYPWLNYIPSNSLFQVDYVVEERPAGWTWDNIFFNYSDTLVIRGGSNVNEVFINGIFIPFTVSDTSTFFAWDVIILEGELSFTFPIEFRAGIEIIDNTTSTIFSTSTIDLIISGFPPEADRVVDPVSDSDLSNFCGDGSMYKTDFNLSLLPPDPNSFISDESPLKSNSKFEVFPNPFEDGFNIHYELLEGGNVSFKLFNSLGKLVNSIESNQSYEGSYNQFMDGENLPRGVYIITLETPDGIQTKKIIKQND